MNTAVRSTPPAVTVTFEPDGAWPERLRAVLAVCSRCIVVDNSLTPEARERVRATVAGFTNVELIANSDNPGLGRALNQGCHALHAAGHPWVITFDQDSTPRPGFGAALLASAAKIGSKRVAVVGANWTDLHRPGFPSRHLQAAPPFGCGFRRSIATHDLEDVLCAITSGSLFSLQAWQDLDGFDEALFLDLVDTDFCLRASQAGWTVAVSALAQLDHQRGAKQPVRFLGRTCYPSFMPPFRLEYLSRNRVRLFLRHGWHARAWVAYETVYAAKLLVDVLLLEDEKPAKLAACLRGTWDGLIRRAPPRRLETKIK